MSAVTESSAGTISQRQLRTLKAFDLGGAILAVITVLSAIVWAFPLYWGIITTLKPEFQVVEPGFNPWPRTFTLEAYIHILTHTNIGLWYLNSLMTSLAVHPSGFGCPASTPSSLWPVPRVLANRRCSMRSPIWNWPESVSVVPPRRGPWLAHGALMAPVNYSPGWAFRRGTRCLAWACSTAATIRRWKA